MLKSPNLRDTPVTEFNSFDTGVTADAADEKDLHALYEGLQFGRKIFDAVVPLDGTFEEVWPGKTTEGEAAMKDCIRREAWVHHACCTARIGGKEDEGAVLDARFRVRGVERLRVVDASVFPRIPGFYIAVPVYMVAEKAAEAVLEDAV